nr:15863_t:CDS:10 [Entrophospora candida]
MSKTNAKASSSKTIEETYIKLTPIEHVLKRPDTYVGSVEVITEKLWIYNVKDDKLEYKEITYVPAFFKIFDEILVNAADNKIRDSSMSIIKVKIDKELGKISVYNNGKGIPIEIHKELNVYVPEMLFGQLMTSSNYDDNEKKVTGGRNGLGAKSANIFSTQFTVETTDTTQKRIYTQLFHNNMTQTDKPKIISYDGKEEYTMISFIPDFEKFGMTELTDDIIALLSKRVFDMAGTVKDVKVFLNYKRIQVKNFKEYVQMYLKSVNAAGASSRTMVVHEHFNDRWEVSVTPSVEGQFQQVSFVNSICTSKGGTHVKHVIDQIVNKLTEHIEKKNKGVKVKPFQIKNHIWIFINCLIENPAFDSQTKENMTLKQSSYGSKCIIDDDFIKKVIKTGILEDIMSDLKSKQAQELKKTDGVKRNLINVPKLDDAVNAGTRNAQHCTLVLTEGDSAKALALAGFDVVGHNEWGVYPLRGKLLNVRDASMKQISENKEVQAIKKILGLQHNKEYDSLEDLRYGKLMIMTDQDHDGSHIKGLIINFFDHFYPSLLKQPGFLKEFITPIVKVKCQKDRTVLSFFTIPEYEKWKSKNDNGKGWEIKYYKVSQLSGYIAEHSVYHHGEASLHSTIIGLAQDFVGSNNINLLEPIGQFGKRNDGGKSAASARYINTKLTPFARMIFHPDDDILLDYLNEDGQSIEPKWYIPVIPMILVNGAEGIGTGWSTNILNYNPRDIIQNLKQKINGKELSPMHPWYRGFEGEIKQIEKNKYLSYGIVTKISATRVIISELPVRKWTEYYKSKVLTDLRENGSIKNIVRNNCTNEKVDLEIELTIEQMERAENQEGLEKIFQLTNPMATTNMMCFDLNNRLAKYDSPEDILKEFYQVRLNFYVKRRSYLIRKLQQRMNIMDNKIRFINMKLGDEIKFEDELTEISNMTATDIWMKDLDALEIAWDEFLTSSAINNDDNHQPHNDSKGKSSKRSRKSAKTSRKNKGKFKAVRDIVVDDRFPEKNKASIEKDKRQPKRRKIAD